MNIIEELYFGNINPYTKFFNPKSEYAKLMGIIADNEEKLIEYLNALPKAKDEFTKRAFKC